MTVKATEEALWGLYQFASFNRKGLWDAIAMVKALEDKRRVLYQVDFSDVHPFIFPEKAEEDLDRDDLALHGRSVRFLWETLLGTDLSSMPFKLALNPGAQLEALESLWHAEKRIHRRFASYGGGELSKYIQFSDSGVTLRRSDNLDSFLRTWDFDGFRRSLESCISDDALNKRLHEPVRNLLKLFNDGILSNFNDCISEEITQELLSRNVPDHIRKQLRTFFEMNPRAANEMSDWSGPHEKFHNQVDVLNLSLAYSLWHAEGARELFSPLLTHTFRVISAGRQISKTAEYSLVHHSVAPLFYARGVTVEGKHGVQAFCRSGLALIVHIWNELNGHPTIRELKALAPESRAKRLKEERQTEVPVRLYERLQIFAGHFYHVIDPSESVLSAESDEAAPGDSSSGRGDAVTIADVVELIRRKDEAVRTIKRQAGVVRRRFGLSIGGGLTDLFTPRWGHARDVTDWLSDL